MRREYEPALWRREALAQTVALLTARRAGRRHGRDHAGLIPRRYRSRRGGADIWIRHGSGDSAVWGEVNVFGTYEAPWSLAEELRVVDLGAHVGYFARWALERWPVRNLMSVDADPDNFEVLQRNCGALADPRWRTISAAAATAAGVQRFAGGRGAGSALSQVGEDEVETIDALPLLADCDLAKIDIEGGEWEILHDNRFTSCGPPMVVLEYHQQTGLQQPASEAHELLRAAGYEVVAHRPETPAVGVIWATRRRPDHPIRAVPGRPAR